jgi:hypothetical protein
MKTVCPGNHGLKRGRQGRIVSVVSKGVRQTVVIRTTKIMATVLPSERWV